jgi:hypothetical protein
MRFWVWLFLFTCWFGLFFDGVGDLLFPAFIQRVEWGMEPPYEWQGVENWPTRQLELVGANGKSCATVYEEYGDSNAARWVVYGYGFSEYGVTFTRAANVAERHCH